MRRKSNRLRQRPLREDCVTVHSSLPRGIFMRILHESSQAVRMTALNTVREIAAQSEQ